MKDLIWPLNKLQLLIHNMKLPVLKELMKKLKPPLKNKLKITEEDSYQSLKKITLKPLIPLMKPELLKIKLN